MERRRYVGKFRNELLVIRTQTEKNTPTSLKRAGVEHSRIASTFAVSVDCDFGVHPVSQESDYRLQQLAFRDLQL